MPPKIKIEPTTREEFNKTLFLQNYKEKDGGRIVLYTTSMGVVRSTYAKCQAMKQIMRTLMVKFEERDVFMSLNHQQEIRERMQSDDIEVPQLFVDGQYIGVSAQCHRDASWVSCSCDYIYYLWQHAWRDTRQTMLSQNWLACSCN